MVFSVQDKSKRPWSDSCSEIITRRLSSCLCMEDVCSPLLAWKEVGDGDVCQRMSPGRHFPLAFLVETDIGTFGTTGLLLIVNKTGTVASDRGRVRLLSNHSFFVPFYFPTMIY